MRKDQAIERYAAKAVKFWRRNGDMELKYFAIYLGAAADEELAALGVPAVKTKVAKDEPGPAAEFFASDWQMVLHPERLHEAQGRPHDGRAHRRGSGRASR